MPTFGCCINNYFDITEKVVLALNARYALAAAVSKLILVQCHTFCACIPCEAIANLCVTTALCQYIK